MRIGVAEKMGSRIKFDEIEIYMGACFPIQVVVSVCLYASSLTQIDRKSKNAEFLNSFLLISIWDVESIQLFKKRFSQFVNIFLGKYV